MIDRAEDMAEALALPEDALLGSAKVTVTAGRRILVDNHRGILDYSDSQAVIALPRGKLTVSGDGLHLLVMTRDRLVLGGRIRTVEWE